MRRWRADVWVHCAPFMYLDTCILRVLLRVPCVLDVSRSCALRCWSGFSLRVVLVWHFPRCDGYFIVFHGRAVGCGGPRVSVIDARM